MAFGNTYCTISRLEIKDGDKCILIPLGFRMSQNFDQYNQADINCFTFLHIFLPVKPLEVKYCGNVSDIEYIKSDDRHKKGDSYEEYELFMLVHYDFYQKIINEYWKDSEMFKTVDRLPLFNTVYALWEKAKEISQDERNGLLMSKKEKMSKKETEEYLSKYMHISVPEWLKNIYQVAYFMGQMGIAPHPAFCADQHQVGKMYYEKFRTECINLKKPSKKK